MAVIRLKDKKKIAFIASGGGVKAAAFHSGVAYALKKSGFLFQGGHRDAPLYDLKKEKKPVISVYVGASAGTFVGTFLAQGKQIEDLLGSYREDFKSATSLPPLRYRELFNSKISSVARKVLNVQSYLSTLFTKNSVASPFSTDGIRNYLEKHIIEYNKFDDLAAELFIVATEVDDYKKVIFGKKAHQGKYLEYRNDVSISDACSVSMSMPPFYHPQSIQIEGKNKFFFDGEMREPLSSHVGEDTHCDLVICSYTHQPLRMRSESGSVADRGLQAVCIQGLYQALESQIRQARAYRKKEKALVNSIHKFFDEKEISSALKDEFIAHVEDRFGIKENLDYIYIHPRSSDKEMFFLPHFSLKPKHTETIMRKGILAGLSVLKGFTKIEKESELLKF